MSKPLCVDNMPHHTSFLKQCTHGCADEPRHGCYLKMTSAQAGNSADVILTVYVYCRLYFSMMPRLWWHTSAVQPLPSHGRPPPHRASPLHMSGTHTGTALLSTEDAIQFVRTGIHIDLDAYLSPVPHMLCLSSTLQDSLLTASVHYSA